MDTSNSDTIELIPIERITVINPRVRNKKIFKEIVSNIAELGLKRPVTVTRRDDEEALTRSQADCCQAAHRAEAATREGPQGSRESEFETSRTPSVL